MWGCQVNPRQAGGVLGKRVRPWPVKAWSRNSVHSLLQRLHIFSVCFFPHHEQRYLRFISSPAVSSGHARGSKWPIEIPSLLRCCLTHAHMWGRSLIETSWTLWAFASIRQKADFAAAMRIPHIKHWAIRRVMVSPEGEEGQTFFHTMPLLN